MELNMKKKLLCCALLGAMGLAQSAMAQSYDDRWYLTAGAGYNFQDHDRFTDSTPELQLGFGRFFSPNWSWDVTLGALNPFESHTDLHWAQYGVSFDARYHFNKEGRDWAPYLIGGIGYQSHKREFDAFPDPNSPQTDSGSNLAVKIGAGLQGDMSEHIGMRLEAGIRADFDDGGDSDSNNNAFYDPYVIATLLFPLGEREEAPAPVAPTPAADCSTMDDDGDGVNNCNDKCPGSQAGQSIGPDGCPVPLTIDLKGVNFDFDKSTLRPDAVAILDEAVSILGKYPQLRVEVAGHTDSIGTEQYNQGLSERRARAVYDYLTGHGIDASRLVGPNGYGESKPIAPNTNPDGTDNPEGRAKNRRTELNVQN
jgi:OOP family OmpA-OmpF porin